MLHRIEIHRALDVESLIPLINLFAIVVSPSEGSTHEEHEHFHPIVDEDGDSVSGSDDEHVLGGLGGGENPEKNGIRTLGNHHLATPSTPPSLSS